MFEYTNPRKNYDKPDCRKRIIITSDEGLYHDLPEAELC